MCEDLVFNPPQIFPLTTPPTAYVAITIKSSDVNLDFGPHTLRQFVPENPSNQTQYVAGIVIPNIIPTEADPDAIGLENITIRGNNAIIRDFSMNAIRVFGHVANVLIDGFQVINTTLLASAALRPTASNSIYPNPNYNQNNTNGIAFSARAVIIGEQLNNSGGPIFFFGTTTLLTARVKQVTLRNLVIRNAYFNGLSVLTVSDGSMENVTIDDVFTDEGGIVSGAATNVSGLTVGPSGNVHPAIPSPYGIENFQLNNVKVNGTFAGTKDPIFNRSNSLPANQAGAFYCVGMTIATWANNLKFTNCAINDTYCEFKNPVTPAVTVAILNGSMSNVIFDDVQINGVYSLGEAQGIHISGNNNYGGVAHTTSSRGVLMKGMTVSDVQSLGNLELPVPSIRTGRLARGFHLDYAKDLTMVNCTCNNIIINGPADAAAISHGINAVRADVPAPTVNQAFSENVVVENCVSSNAFTVNGGQGLGITANISRLTNTTDVSRAIVFRDCESLGNTSNIITARTGGGGAPLFTVVAASVVDLKNMGDFYSGPGSYTVSFNNTNIIQLLPNTGGR